jgi:hypothetical protein
METATRKSIPPCLIEYKEAKPLEIRGSVNLFAFLKQIFTFFMIFLTI